MHASNPLTLYPLTAAFCLISILPVSAQTPPPTPQRPAQQQNKGVVRPPPGLDRGMTKPAPKLPPQSMPVIHPRQVRKSQHGTTIVVPK